MAAPPAPFLQTSRPGLRGRWPGALAVLVVVLLAHALLLGRWPGAAGSGASVQPMQVTLRAAAAPARPAMGLPVDHGPRPAEAVPPPRAQRATPPAAQAAQAAAAAAPAEGSDQPATRAAPATEAPAAAAPGGQPVPTYRTALPPPATLIYTLQRGRASGAAELAWQPAGDRYAITLTGRFAAAPALGGSSEGGLDAHGIAPLRYVESRRGRDLRAANFQRERGVVSFSGPSVEYPLVAGGQDRLSWMLQLAGVMAADPSLAGPGREVAVWVAGARGDAEVWTFTVQGTEDIELPAGAVPGALRLLREPIGPYDTRAEVWLDPARHHLPVQVRLGIRAGGEPLEFRLQELRAAAGS